MRRDDTVDPALSNCIMILPECGRRAEINSCPYYFYDCMALLEPMSWQDFSGNGCNDLIGVQLRQQY